MTLPQKLFQSIQELELFKPGAKVIVGVSGGADSIALLHLLHNLRHKLGIELVVAHYNHNLRRDSIKDQRFVERCAAQLNLICKTGEWKSPIVKTKSSIEEQARLKRFAFFKKVIKQTKASCVCLAHTQDDLAETTLMRILRGSGLEGLRAILPKREIDNMMVVRPLLEFKKQELLRHLKKHRITFREDSTNKNIQFFRNKIRQKLFPILEKSYSSQIKHHLVQLSYQATAAYDLLEQEMHKGLRKTIVKTSPKYVVLNRQKLLREHTAIQNMIFRQAFAQLTGSKKGLTSKHIEGLHKLLKHQPTGSKVHLHRKITVTKKVSYLTFSHE